jgi:hypothetical protein
MLEPRRTFFFQKWYFDAQGDDGSFLFLYFADFRLAGTRSGQLVVCLLPAGGTAQLRSFSMPGRFIEVSSDCGQAEFRHGELANLNMVALTGDHPAGLRQPSAGLLDVPRSTPALPPSTASLSGRRLPVQSTMFDCPSSRSCLGRGRVRFKREDVELSLTYEPRDEPWVPPNEGRLFEDRGRLLTWRVPIPSAVVTGSVAVGPLAISVSGLGYHDFVQTDIPPWRLPLRELLWGRALGQDGAVIWDRLLFAAPEGRREVSLGWWRQGTAAPRTTERLSLHLEEMTNHPSTGDAYPKAMRIGCATGEGEPGLSLALGDTRLMLGDCVADVALFRNRFERWLYRTFTGNPVEYKLLSRAEGSGWLDGALAAHELVRWGRGR